MTRWMVHPKNLPMYPPIKTTAILYLLLRVHEEPGWLPGVVWTVLGFVWICWISDLFCRRYIELHHDGTLHKKEGE